MGFVGGVPLDCHETTAIELHGGFLLPATWHCGNTPQDKRLVHLKIPPKKEKEKHRPKPLIFRFHVYFQEYMGVSKNRGGPPKSSILIGFSIIFTIHFWKHPYVSLHLYLDMLLGGGNSNILGIFSPILEEMLQFDGSHIFQVGKNHQLGHHMCHSLNSLYWG